jgi:hypothetical protein
LASLAVTPGLPPADFCLKMTHFDGSGGAPRFGPRTSSSMLTVRAPTRLVNQLESGTSSIVLMFCARNPDGLRPGSANEL